MKDTDVIASFNNAWRALARQYGRNPSEGIRCAMNLTAGIIGKVESEVRRTHEGKQVTIEEWLAWLEAGE